MIICLPSRKTIDPDTPSTSSEYVNIKKEDFDRLVTYQRLYYKCVEVMESQARTINCLSS